MYVRNYTRIAESFAKNQSNEFLSEPRLDAVEIKHCLNGWNFDPTIFQNTIITEWNLVCDKDYYATIALVLFGVGGLIGNYVFGYLQDYWGRKPSFYTYLLLEIISCILSSLAWNFTSWIAFRITVGLTIPAILASPYVLAIELVGPEKRVFCTIVTNIAYSLGLILLSGIVYIFRDWRALTLAVSIPLFLLFSCFFILPESPRWLLATRQYDKAANILNTIAKYNGKSVPSNYKKILVEKFISNKNQNENENDRSYGIQDLFTTVNMRRKTIIITFIWFATTSVYVGLSYYAPALGGDEIWNFFLAGAVELPTYLILWPSLNYFGRRYILCISMVVGGVACLATFLFQENKTVMLTLYCIGKMGISSAFVVLPLTASELYPTVVRGLGMSVSSVIGMIGPIVIPIINYMVKFVEKFCLAYKLIFLFLFQGSDMLVLPLIIMGALLTIGGITSLLLPETKGRPLPQTIEDGESVPLTKNPYNW